MRRYHVQYSGKNNGEAEWDVLDRMRKHPNCENCPGVSVATLTTRALARAVCAERNAEWADEQEQALQREIDEQHYNGCGDPK